MSLWPVALGWCVMSCSGGAGKDGGAAPPKCALNLGEKPALEVLPSDVDTAFGNHWEAHCTTCHGSGISSNAFHPRMPAHPLMDADTIAGAASSLSRYCQSADPAILTENLQPDAGYNRIRLVCTLLPPAPVSTDFCYHGAGMPSNSGSLADHADLLVPCERAYARYRATLAVWGDGGFGDGTCQDAGP